MLRFLPLFLLTSLPAWAQLPPGVVFMRPAPPVVAAPQPAPLAPAAPSGQSPVISPVPVNPAPPAPDGGPNIEIVRNAPPPAPAGSGSDHGFFGTAKGVYVEPAQNVLSPEEIRAGWRLLFDGSRLIGLRGVQRPNPLAGAWKIRDGTLVRTAGGVGGDLVTMESFTDYEFRFEWRAAKGASSGVRYMTGPVVSQTPAGLEYQVADDLHSPIATQGGALRRSGALEVVLPVGENATFRVGEDGPTWNSGRIVVQGNRVEHWLNNEKVLEFELGAPVKAAAEKSTGRAVPASYGMKVKSPVCLIDENTEVAFRNLKVRIITPR